MWAQLLPAFLHSAQPMPVAYGLLDPIDLPVSDLPPALEGFRVMHVTDLHLFKPRFRFDRLLEQVTRQRVDLVALTGDYTHRGYDPELAQDWLKALCERVDASVELVGVFGNHDHDEFREAVAATRIRWLNDEVWSPEDRPLEVLGLGMGRRPGDVLALAERLGQREVQHPRLRMMLTHTPTAVLAGPALGAKVVLAGHTHGGQVRLPGRRALKNACDLPLDCSAGLIRHGDSLMALSRGLGEGPGLPRVFCRPHVPVYTLRGQPLPGQPTHGVRCIRAW